MRYARIKLSCHLGVVAYLAAALAIGFFAGHREVFPVFTWSLFSRSTREYAEWAVLVDATGDERLDPPLELRHAGRLFPVHEPYRVHATVQRMGWALWHEDEEELRSARRVLESVYLAGAPPPVRYRLVLRLYDPIERWRGGPVRIEREEAFVSEGGR